MKKRSEATQALRAGCSKADPQTNKQTHTQTGAISVKCEDQPYSDKRRTVNYLRGPVPRGRPDLQCTESEQHDLHVARYTYNRRQSRALSGDYNYESTLFRLPFDCDSTTIRRDDDVAAVWRYRNSLITCAKEVMFSLALVS